MEALLIAAVGGAIAVAVGDWLWEQEPWGPMVLIVLTLLVIIGAFVLLAALSMGGTR